MRITNNGGISLPLAVWLVSDDYDYQSMKNYISVTRIMKPLKQLILPQRIPVEEREADVLDFVARKLGNAIHDSMEQAWTKSHARSMRLLGYSDDVIRRVVVNPVTEQLRTIEDIIPVYIEQRGFREIEVDGVVYTIGGKFDMVADGFLNDNKTTSAFGWVHGTRDDDYVLQMSLYRWIDANRTDGGAPRVTEDICNVNYVFTDWQKAQARSNPNYPQRRVEAKALQLLDLNQVEQFVVDKLRSIRKHSKLDESQMPPCSDKELWRSDPKYKYFSDPTKASDPGARSTKNFDDMSEARAFMASKGGKGVIVTKPGEVKACGYCDAFPICRQKEEYFS